MSVASDLGGQGRDVDDLATLLGHHAWGDELPEQEWSPEIDGLRLLPVFDRGIEQALAMKAPALFTRMSTVPRSSMARAPAMRGPSTVPRSA